jgi:selenide,water dikinase
MERVRLTEYSHGGGCGCKIAPEYLERILGFDLIPTGDTVRKPLVGNATRDDAAIYDLGGGMGLLCTTDFFMPIVDDPFDFGRIAAANALSDIYAMGGSPLGAIAILGWPVKKLSTEAAQLVLKGACKKCEEAGIVVAGGHSIDNPEPIFGLAVNGLVDLACIKRNSTAEEGDLLFLTKPLGVGILSTAGKKEVLREEDYRRALEVMLKLNSVGARFGKFEGVRAMTDVTGFGLLGHLAEMCGASGLTAKLHFEEVPLLPNLEYYIERGCVTGGSVRNLKSYGHKVRARSEFERVVLSDPQTNGGLLVAVKPAAAADFKALVRTLGPGESVSLIGQFEGKHAEGPLVTLV